MCQQAGKTASLICVMVDVIHLKRWRETGSNYNVLVCSSRIFSCPLLNGSNTDTSTSMFHFFTSWPSTLDISINPVQEMNDQTHTYFCSQILDFQTYKTPAAHQQFWQASNRCYCWQTVVVHSLWGYCWTLNTSENSSQEASKGREDRWHPCQRCHHKHHENIQTTVQCSHRLPLFWVEHLCCSVPRGATPIITEICNPLGPLRPFYFPLHRQTHKTDHNSTFYDVI